MSAKCRFVLQKGNVFYSEHTNSFTAFQLATKYDIYEKALEMRKKLIKENKEKHVTIATAH